MTITKDSTLTEILDHISTYHANDYVLVITPDGAGNLAIPIPGNKERYQNILFPNITTLTQPQEAAH
ncbi:hypothetical protein [Enterovibrio paralichthyis]|uniref:hypothetical protein n=1 Tax=Enterovibrio paralichthyis TaxID=2853805 RepID=UPI001C482573|nr:hypothetical protein [Enterovibrio paralichthyis]MBV7300217.1 hypothetical protein [Enterovibrio paralichthyis]